MIDCSFVDHECDAACKMAVLESKNSEMIECIFRMIDKEMESME